MHRTHLLRTGTRFVSGMLALTALSLIPFYPPRPIHAQGVGGGGGGGETPYGGMRAVTIVCTCSSNLLLYIQDYRTSTVLKLLYQPGASMLYSNSNIYGMYLLGTYGGGGTCEIYAGTSCVELQSDGQLGSQPGSGTS